MLPVWIGPQVWLPVTTKKNTTLPWPAFQTWRSGSHGTVGACSLWMFSGPRRAVIEPFAISAPLGHPASDLALPILARLHVGKLFPLDTTPYTVVLMSVSGAV